MTAPFRVLFVCMGNICRSPTAHGVLRHKLRQHPLGPRVQVDSAGTHNYHPGEAPDPRSRRHAQRRGYELSDLRARPIAAADFHQADLVLVMDDDNLEACLERCPSHLRHKLGRLTDYCRAHRSTAVPDPYYGEGEGFERVLDLVEDACDGLLAHLARRLHTATPAAPTVDRAEHWRLDAGEREVATLDIPAHAQRERHFDVSVTLLVQPAGPRAWHRLTVLANGSREWQRQVDTDPDGGGDGLEHRFSRVVPTGQALRVVAQTEGHAVRQVRLRIEVEERPPA